MGTWEISGGKSIANTFEIFRAPKDAVTDDDKIKEKHAVAFIDFGHVH